MKNCPICGTELPDTARFCSHCGHTLITPPEAPLKSPAVPDYAASRLPTRSPMAQGRMGSAVKWLIVAILAFVLLAGGLSALFVVLGSHSSGTDSTPNAVTSTSSNTRATSIASACTGSTGATSSTCSTAAVSPMPIVSRGTVNLTFSGAVKGQMTSTIVVTCGASSSVAGGMQYHLAIFGTVGGQQYAFTFGVYPYTGPNAYANSAFSFFGPAGDNSSITKWRSRLNLGISVMIHSDGKTGTLDIGYLSSSDNSTARVAGSWKCA